MLRALKKLTEHLSEKLWMTAGLGAFFTCTFWGMSRILTMLSQDSFNTIVQIGRQKPWVLGLSALAMVSYTSLLIYAIRRIVIEIYRNFHE